eukprot:snap_masked-scaffold_26-processed-gene-4.109-mRNA-1 protein AED:1.00 eAED:1.00 QI:0/0/0/0/1/1/2/0/115
MNQIYIVHVENIECEIETYFEQLSALISGSKTRHFQKQNAKDLIPFVKADNNLLYEPVTHIVQVGNTDMKIETNFKDFKVLRTGFTKKIVTPEHEQGSKRFQEERYIVGGHRDQD